MHLMRLGLQQTKVSLYRDLNFRGSKMQFAGYPLYYVRVMRVYIAHTCQRKNKYGIVFINKLVMITVAHVIAYETTSSLGIQ